MSLKLKKQWKAQLKELRVRNFLFLFFAGIINSIGVTMFLAPVDLYDSGFSGTSMLFWQLTPEPYTLSLFLVILNLPLFLYGLRKQGANFTIYSIFAVLVYSLSSYLITYILPIDVMTASPFAGQDLLLCAIFGGIISGIGSGLTIRFGGAIDGVEVMAVIYAKKLGITVGTFVMAYNVLLYIVVGCVMQSWTLPLYSIITYGAAIKTVDFIVDGFDKVKSVMIITEKTDVVSAALSEVFGHGITIMNAEGFYSKETKNVIYFVINRFQVAKLKSTVLEIDPNAFITVSEVSDAVGHRKKEQ